MSEDQNDNVLKFPGKQREVTPTANQIPTSSSNLATEVVTVPLRDAAQMPVPKPGGKRAAPPVGVAVTFAAIALATIAANRFAYRPSITDLAAGSGRVIASANPHLNVERDAAWEKDLAERLSEPKLGATAELGRPATLGERLRFAALEDNYAVGYEAKTESGGAPRITSITLGRSAAPLAVDRSRLLATYGRLFEPEFADAHLKSVAASARGVTEVYELKDQAGRVRAALSFELDQDRRLLSVSNAPVQI